MRVDPDIFYEKGLKIPKIAVAHENMQPQLFAPSVERGSLGFCSALLSSFLWIYYFSVYLIALLKPYLECGILKVLV